MVRTSAARSAWKEAKIFIKEQSPNFTISLVSISLFPLKWWQREREREREKFIWTHKADNLFLFLFFVYVRSETFFGAGSFTECEAHRHSLILLFFVSLLFWCLSFFFFSFHFVIVIVVRTVHYFYFDYSVIWACLDYKFSLTSCLNAIYFQLLITYDNMNTWVAIDRVVFLFFIFLFSGSMYCCCYSDNSKSHHWLLLLSSHIFTAAMKIANELYIIFPMESLNLTFTFGTQEICHFGCPIQIKTIAHNCTLGKEKQNQFWNFEKWISYLIRMLLTDLTDFIELLLVMIMIDKFRFIMWRQFLKKKTTFLQKCVFSLIFYGIFNISTQCCVEKKHSPVSVCT